MKLEAIANRLNHTWIHTIWIGTIIALGLVGTLALVTAQSFAGLVAVGTAIVSLITYVVINDSISS